MVSDLLLVSDMDGTLLTRDKRISDRNMEAVRRFTSYGGRFTIATGRSVVSAERYVKLLELRQPAILFNGAAVYDYGKKGIIWHTDLIPEAIDYVRDIMRDFPTVGVEVLTEEQIHIPRWNRYVTRHVCTENLTYRLSTVDEISSGWLKVLFALDHDLIPSLASYVREKNYAGVDFVESDQHYFEMLPQGNSKGTALLQLADILQVPHDHLIAVGDYYNDLEMIRKAYLGVAVSNAPNEVKDAADLVLGSHEEDAFADLIDLILGE